MHCVGKQAEKEMRGDRRFLENVYGIKNLGQYIAGLPTL